MQNLIEENLLALENDLNEVLTKYPNFDKLSFLKFDIETDTDFIYCEIHREIGRFLLGIDCYPNEYINDFNDLKKSLSRFLRHERLIKTTIHNFK